MTYRDLDTRLLRELQIDARRSNRQLAEALGVAPERLDEQRFRYRIRFDQLPLLPGTYSVRGHAMDPEGMRLFDTTEIRFSVSGNSREMGIVHLPHRWGDAGD